MKWPHLLLPVLLSIALPCTAEEIDWKKIALETDEPAFGQLISRVLPNSQGEKLGLQAGDYIVQIDDQQIRGYGSKRTREDQILFFVRKGGRLEEAIVHSGNIGYYYSEIFRPWLAYLRGEIGVLSDEWENDVVAFLMQLRNDPPEKLLESWEAIREKGYPEDELDAVIRARIAWQQNEPAQVRDAFEKVVAEFEALPMIYFTMLEDLAVASNQTGVLRELHRLDPATSMTTDDQIRLWDELEVDPNPPHLNLLAKAEQLRGRDIVTELERLEGEKDSVRGIELFRRSRRSDVSPGRFINFRNKIPDDVTNFHFHMVVVPECSGYSDSWVSNVKVSIDSIHKSGKAPYGSSLISRIGIGDSPYSGPYILSSGAHNAMIRKTDDEGLRIGLYNLDENKKMIRIREMPKTPHTLDMICLDGESAVFCDGRPYSHLPFSQDHDGLAVVIHLSGMGALFTEINFWELNP